MLGWLAIAGGGLAVVKGFMGSLSNTRPGPVGSPSRAGRAARYAFDTDFPGASPVMLTVLVTSTDGVTPLVYRNESFDSAGGASGHRDTPITVAAANELTSHAVLTRVPCRSRGVRIPASYVL